MAAEAEGFQLHLSSNNATGYKGVYRRSSGRFGAERKAGGRTVYLGSFVTAVGAVVAYARAVGQAAAAGEAGPSAAAASEASGSGESEPGGAGGEAAAAESSSDEGEGSSEEEAVSCLWVACDRCDKWRRLPSGMPGPLPAEWFCWMHPDPACRVCEAPEEESAIAGTQLAPEEESGPGPAIFLDMSEGAIAEALAGLCEESDEGDGGGQGGGQGVVDELELLLGSIVAHIRGSLHLVFPPAVAAHALGPVPHQLALKLTWRNI